MNNAANNIDATSKSLRNLLKERRYNVGYFQREYKWQKTHIEDLLDDLERSFFSNHNIEHSQSDVADYDAYYMGPVVLFREGSAFSIVDGQQRLTSFTLLIIYINHLQRQVYATNQKKIQKLDEYVFSQNFGIETYNLNIQERINILDKLFKNKEIEEEDFMSESCDNILERYKDIEDLFSNKLKNEEILALFVNWLTEKLVFIEIVTQSSDSAYTIFETMNDRGLNLTPSEMLKSHLLASVKDETKIKELDAIWKTKIGILKEYSHDEDQDFFRAWLRAKYAETIRLAQSGAENEDFEKIGTRFHTWVKESFWKLHLKTPDDYYYLVQSDFQFFCELYLKLIELESSHNLPEHDFKLLSYKGVSSSLSYPLIMSSINKIDNDEIINEKIDLTVKFIDCLSTYRLLLNLPITQSSIRNSFYIMIREIRKMNLSQLKERLTADIASLKRQFLEQINYISFDRTYTRYVLARLYKINNPAIYFEDLLFQRKKDSYVLYQFFTWNDVDGYVHKIPKALKDIFLDSVCSYCLVPRYMVSDLNSYSLTDRIKFLIKNNFLSELPENFNLDANNLKDFFIMRNKRLKDAIINLWRF